MQDFYFIVTFAVPAGHENDFRQEFSAIAERLRQSPGGSGGSGALYEVAAAIETHLLQAPGISTALQNRPNARASFRFALIAHWESLSHYEAAVRASESRKPISFPAYPAYYRIAAEYKGAESQPPPPPQGFTFINPFEIPAGQEAEFQVEWRNTVERLIAAPGFVAARLYEVDDEVEAHLSQAPGISAVLQNRPDAKARFRFVWVSQWASVSQYEAAVRSFGRGKPFSFPSHPAFYQPVK